jgi:hypothetical protein
VSSSAGDENDFFAGLSFVLPDRELRVTKRCLVEDLGGSDDTTLEKVADHPIVRAFLRERRDKTIGTRNIGQLSSGHEVWVLTQGQRHRGGTWYEEGRGIIWLVAAGHHESGSPDDFYPYCKGLDRSRRLAPSESDYESLFVEQDARFAARILIDAPLLRKRAEEKKGEVSGSIGGRFGVAVAIEVADDLQEMTVAFDLRSLGVQEYVPAILAALEADAEWEFAEQMPSRPLKYYEQAFSHMSIGG